MGTLVNTAAVIIGSLAGLGLGKLIPQRLNGSIMQGIGLCIAFLGISGFSGKTNPLVLIIAMVTGIIIGEVLDLDLLLNRLGEAAKKRFSRSCPSDAPASAAPEKPNSFSEGFVTSTLLWCTGAMVVIGCIQDGIQGDPGVLYAKSALDLVSSIMLASSLGSGVLAASASVFVIQGTLTLAAGRLAPFLTEAVVTDISTVGSLLLIALSFNMLGLTKIKVMNYTPACLMPILIHVSGLAALLSK